MSVLLEALAYDDTHNPNPLRGHYAYHFCQNHDPDCGCGNHARSCGINRILCWHYWSYYMARNKNSKKQAFGAVEFIRFELTADDKKALTKWVEREKDNFDMLVDEVVMSGHKMTLSFNEQNDSHICSVTGKPDDCINASRCYTSHGKTYLMAMWVALYKFHVIWKRGVWESLAEESDFG